MTPLRPADHLRGALVLAAMCAALVLGTPGLDMLSESTWAPGSRDRAEMLAQRGGWIPVAFADLNRAVRMPVVRWLTPVQRPLRLAQSWSLYGAGPPDVRRFEVRVDGEVVYRSNDPERRWHRSVFRYRRVRPVISAHCRQRSKNSHGLVRYVARQALRAWPDARSVEIACTRQPWARPSPPEVVARRTLAGPSLDALREEGR